jgi:putative ABC transport system permease protein
MLRYLPLILKNSVRNRRRSLLTISSLGASMCLLGVLFALYRGLFLSAAPPAQALRLITHHRVSLAQALPLSYEQRIRQVPGVREVMVWQWFGGAYKDARDPNNFFARFAVEPDKFWTIYSDYSAPANEKRAFQTLRTGAVASRTLADKFNWKIGDRITLVGDIFPVNLDLTLVGIYNDPEKNEALYFNREYLREAMGPGPRQDMIGAFQILAANTQAAKQIPDEVDAMFENAPEPTKTESEHAFGLSFVSFLGNVKVFLLSICGAVTFTILLVSANTMAMSVRERVGEVGILKTLGFPNGAILGIILGEAGIISLAGGAVGLVLASGLTAVIRQGPAYIQSIKTLSVTPSVALFCMAFALFVGVLSAIVPAAGASRTSILDSLRSTV